jgi:polyisoprenoid-binding protein YceI
VTTWTVDPERTTVTIDGKSSLHAIHGTVRPGSVTGTVEATLADGLVDTGAPVSGTIAFPMEALSFGNAMYDRELPKRMETTRYPEVSLALDKVQPVEPGTHQVTLTLGLHGTSVAFDETVRTEVTDDGTTLTVSGQHRFDVRQFGVEPPRMLGMKVHPEFTVSVKVVAHRDA